MPTIFTDHIGPQVHDHLLWRLTVNVLCGAQTETVNNKVFDFLNKMLLHQ